MNLKISIGFDKSSVEQFLDLSAVRLLLLLGATGTGKSVLQTHIFRQLADKNSPEAVGFVFLDMTRTEFVDWGAYLQCPVEYRPVAAIEFLKKVARDGIAPEKHIFVHIEECDMFNTDSKAMIAILKEITRTKPNIHIFYSTSRPSPVNALPKEILEMADTKIVFEQGSDDDLRHIFGNQMHVSLHDHERILVQGKRIVQLCALERIG